MAATSQTTMFSVFEPLIKHVITQVKPEKVVWEA
jgi:hypothetical protein